jgi:hypothetical protein
VYWLSHGLPHLGTAIGAFIDEVDLRHAPVWLDIAHKHGLHSDAAGADDGRHLDFVMVDIGWHMGSPSNAKAREFNPAPNLAADVA